MVCEQAAAYTYYPHFLAIYRIILWGASTDFDKEFLQPKKAARILILWGQEIGRVPGKYSHRKYTCLFGIHRNTNGYTIPEHTHPKCRFEKVKVPMNSWV